MAHKGAGGTFAAFDAWSQRHPKYDADTTRRMWEGLKPDGRITLGTLVHELKQHGIKPPRHTGAEQPGDKAGAADTAAEAEAETRPPQFSDDALALRFAADYADKLRYVAAWGKWMSWAGTCWRTDDTLLSFDRVRLICREAAATAIASEKPKLAPILTSAKTVAAVTGLARSDRRLAATSDQWDADLDALNNQEDTVNLRTGEPYKSRPEDYMTKAAAVSPAGYCPLWRAFLDRITADDGELQAYLQRVAGYCLTGHTSEHAVFFLYGTGANGKSVFVNTLVKLMGDYAITAPMEAFIESKVDRHPTELAMLRGARLVAASETQVGRHWNEARVKALTGGDRIPARFMRGDFFEFTPQFKLMISGNHKPSLRNVDEAMRRRLHIIPFTVTIPPAERDLDLAEKLKAEWPGILQWAIDGALEWRRIGLKPPEAVQQATRDYLEAEDDILSWITECCTQEAAARTRSADLYASWKDWAERTGRKGGAGSQKAFSQALEDKGYPKKKGRAVAMFFGLRVASQDLGL